MDLRMAYCATCDRPVRVIVKRSVPSGEQVSSDEVICLDHGELCFAGTICPIFDVPSEQMKRNPEVSP